MWPKGEEKEYLGGWETSHLYMYTGMVGRNIGESSIRVRVMSFVTFVISE